MTFGLASIDAPPWIETARAVVTVALAPMVAALTEIPLPAVPRAASLAKNSVPPVTVVPPL